MKKVGIVVLAGIAVFAAVVTGMQYLGLPKMTLPFAAQEVSKVVMYHYIVPADTEQKVITDRETIERIYETVYNLRIRKGTGTDIVGAETLNFVFSCTDGTEFEVQTTLVERGTRVSHTYTTHEAVLPLWYECGVAPEQIPT